MNFLIILAGLVLYFQQGYAQTYCNGVPIYSRDEWGARPPNCESPMSTPVTFVFIHHTVTPECYDFTSCSASVRQVQDFHMDGNGWCDIGYNFLIGGDGAVYEGVGWDKVGTHTVGYNDRAVAYSLIGNFEDYPVPQIMLDTAAAMIGCAVVELDTVEDLYSLHGHRDASCTACPGINVYNAISGWQYFNRLEVDYDC